jgi:prolipoprotein diacylglyceryltransferase
MEIGGVRIRWYGVLQHLSTIFGMVVLTIWAVRRLRAPHAPDPPRHFLPPVSNKVRALAVLFILAVSFAYAIARFMAYPDNPLENRLFHFAIAGMTGFALAWLAVAIYIGWSARATARLGAREENS